MKFEVEKLTDSSLVKESFGFQDHPWLQTNHSDHMVEHGILSEGHDHVTAAQRYKQCYRELYSRANSAINQEVQKLRAKADLLKAEHELENAKEPWDEINAEADILDAKHKLATTEFSIKEKEREMRKFNEIRLQLKPEMDRRYPKGVEQAERDIWLANVHLKLKRNPKERIENTPLSPEDKAMIGMEYHREDTMAALIVRHLDERNRLKPKALQPKPRGTLEKKREAK